MNCALTVTSGLAGFSFVAPSSLYPAYFVFLAYLIVMPVAKALKAGGWHNALHLLCSKLNDYWPNFLFLQNYVGSNPAMHTWSLAVEEHFYILLPILVLWLSRRGSLRWLTAIGLLSPVIFTILRLACWYLGDPYIDPAKHPFMFATHLRMDGLAIGVGLRSLKEYSPPVFQALGRWRWLWLIAGTTLMLLPVPVLPTVQVGAAMVLLGVIHLGAADFGFLSGVGVPVIRFLGWIGLYSYSIYLWHATLVGVSSKVFISHLHLDPLRPFSWFLNRILIVASCVVGGWAAARLVEWPVLKIRERYFPARPLARPLPVARQSQSAPATAPLA